MFGPLFGAVLLLAGVLHSYHIVILGSDTLERIVAKVLWVTFGKFSQHIAATQHAELDQRLLIETEQTHSA